MPRRSSAYSRTDSGPRRLRRCRCPSTSRSSRPPHNHRRCIRRRSPPARSSRACSPPSRTGSALPLRTSAPPCTPRSPAHHRNRRESCRMLPPAARSSSACTRRPSHCRPLRRSSARRIRHSRSPSSTRPRPSRTPLPAERRSWRRIPSCRTGWCLPRRIPRQSHTCRTTRLPRIHRARPRTSRPHPSRSSARTQAHRSMLQPSHPPPCRLIRSPSRHRSARPGPPERKSSRRSPALLRALRPRRPTARRFHASDCRRNRANVAREASRKMDLPSRRRKPIVRPEVCRQQEH